jgi:hypothetical protein
VPNQKRVPDAGGPGSHWSPCDFGFCILIFWHCGHRHLRFLWKIWPFSSFIVTLHFLQVIATRSHFVSFDDSHAVCGRNIGARTLENANRAALRHTRILDDAVFRHFAECDV